jgi:hypothetical protein
MCINSKSYTDIINLETNITLKPFTDYCIKYLFNDNYLDITN